MKALLMIALWVPSVFAVVSADRIHTVESKKTQIYMKDGIFTGGNREAESATIKEIRRANNTGFERIVLDIESPKIPYYQVSVDPTLKRVTMTVFGDPTLAFNAPAVVKAFQKSATVSRVDLYPKMDGSTFSMVMQLKGTTPIEVFELTSPNRIIFDLKSSGAPVTANANTSHEPVKRFVGKKKKSAEAPTQVYPAESDASSDEAAEESHVDESAPE